MFSSALWTASIVLVAAPALAQSQTREEPRRPLSDAVAEAGPLLSGITVPSAELFKVGDRTIAAKAVEKGPVAVTGTLRVAGTIDGDAFSYTGDIVVESGGRITGNAIALLGKVRLEGGEVEGEWRSLGGDLDPVAPIVTRATTKENIGLTLGWACIVLIVGIGVLVFGGRTLDVVGATIDQQFGKSFLVGLGAELALLPGLALVVLGLTLTILGVLLVPFAIVAYLLAATGLVTLGFLAAVRMTGHSIGSANSRLTERGAALRALVVGTTIFLGLWLVAALVTSWPTAEWIVRLVAFAVTWAAATVGLGATIISRGGTRTKERDDLARLSTLPPLDHEALAVSALPDWQTPTPVTGVVAAKRRPSAAHKAS